MRAPFDGRIGERFIDEGAVVSAGAAVLTLLETERRQARIGVPPDVAEKLIADQSLTLNVNGRNVAAKVLAQRPDLDTSTLTVTLLLEIDAGATEAPLGELARIGIVCRRSTTPITAWRGLRIVSLLVENFMDRALVV